MFCLIFSDTQNNKTENLDNIFQENKIDFIEYIKDHFPNSKININTFKLKNKTIYYGSINDNLVFLSKEDLYNLFSDGYKLNTHLDDIFFEARDSSIPGKVLIKKRSLLYSLDKFAFKTQENIPIYDFTKSNEIYIIPVLFEFLRFHDFPLHRVDVKPSDDKKIKDIKKFQKNTVENLVKLMDKICTKIKSTISLEQEDKIKKIKIYQEIISTLPLLEEIPEDTGNMMKVLFKEAETALIDLHPQKNILNHDTIFNNISDNIDKKIKTTFFDISKVENELFQPPYLVYNKIPIDKNKENYIYCYINQKQDSMKILTSRNIKEIYYEFKKFDDINFLAITEYLNDFAKKINPNLNLHFSFDFSNYIWLDYIEMTDIKDSPMSSLKIHFDIGLSILKIMYSYFKSLDLLSNGQAVSFLKQLIKIHNKIEKTDITLQDVQEISEEELVNLKNFISDQIFSFKLIAGEKDLKKQKFLLYKTQILYNISEIFDKQLLCCKDNKFVILGTAKEKYNTVGNQNGIHNNLIVISYDDLLELYENGFIIKNNLYFYRKIFNEFGGEVDTQAVNTIYSLEKFLHNITQYDFEISYLPENQPNEITIKMPDCERSFDIRLLLYQYLKEVICKDLLSEIVENHVLYKNFRNLNIKKLSEQELKEFKDFVNDNVID